MKRHIEFTIERLTQDNNGRLVDGRVCDSPIRVGDVFTKIYGQKQRFDGEVWIDVNPGPIDTVQLVIQSIESYRHSFDEIDHGMTARLMIVGDGLDKLVEGKVLGNDRTIS